MRGGLDEEFSTACSKCGHRLETRVAFESFPMILEVRLKWNKDEGGPTAATSEMVIPRHLDLSVARYEFLGSIWRSKPTPQEHYEHFSNEIMIYDDLYSDEGSLDSSKGLLHLLVPTPPYELSQFFNCASKVLRRLYFIKRRENSSQAEMHCISRCLRKNAVGKPLE